MSKAYIVKGSKGEWEDFHQWNECVFLDKQKAEDYKNKLNDELNLSKEKNEGKLFSSESKCDDCCTTIECEDCEYYEIDSYDYSLDDYHGYGVEECELIE